MKLLKKLHLFFLGLVTLLSNSFGSQTDGEQDDTELLTIDGDEDEDDEGEETGEEDEDSDDAEYGDDDTGTNVGKNRSKMIPRERFDKVNAKAKKIEGLIAAGILQETVDGEIVLNTETLKSLKAKAPKNDDSDEDDEDSQGADNKLFFTRDEVGEESWPLVQKINRHFKKVFKIMDERTSELTNALLGLQSENAVLRDYPEYLQKEGPLRKQALEILKKDPEFLQIYKNNPQRGYYAVKRAAERLAAASKGEKPKVKPKSSFITGRSDSGKSGKKVVDISTLSKEQLDDLERKENARLNNQRLRNKK